MGVTPPHIVFEWLLTEGFARAGRGRDTVNTPGTLKAQAVYRGGESMSARSYLKTPAVFGLHGVHKPIAVATGIVSEDFELREHGYQLVRAWDLVLDPTCGSGTTAAVAEQWGRRWITIDTSRVALALARQRLMGARYPYFLLSDSAAGRQKESELSAEPLPPGDTAND